MVDDRWLMSHSTQGNSEKQSNRWMPCSNEVICTLYKRTGAYTRDHFRKVANASCIFHKVQPYVHFKVYILK